MSDEISYDSAIEWAKSQEAGYRAKAEDALARAKKWAETVEFLESEKSGKMQLSAKIRFRPSDPSLVLEKVKEHLKWKRGRIKDLADQFSETEDAIRALITVENGFFIGPKGWIGIKGFHQEGGADPLAEY